MHGAGFAGLLLAKGLRAAGVHVHVVDPCGSLAGASAASARLVLPTHPEHPHRFEAGLGTARAAELVDFVRQGLHLLPGLHPTGVDWWISDREGDDLAPALAAAARLGLSAYPNEHGYHLDGGGWIDPAALGLGDIPVFPHTVSAEVDIWACPADPWLADKITPVRLQSMELDVASPAIPVVTRHGTVWWTPGAAGLEATGARWATPHFEVGETLPTPEPRVTEMLRRLTAEFVGHTVQVRTVRSGILAESCDGLPIVGAIPGRPRSIVCTAFGAAGFTYLGPCTRAVVDGLLGRGDTLPGCLRAGRFT